MAAMAHRDELIDSHCHLQYLPEEERVQALDEARERGVTGFLVPAVNLDDAEELLKLCQREPGVWCALGVHPHDAESWQAGDRKRLESLLAEPGVVAVGECGLDFHYDHSPRQRQHEVMTTQWQLAAEAGLPVIVHNRESDAEICAALRRPEFSGLRAVLHSFAGSEELLQLAIERNDYCGMSGMVTFKKADNVRSALARIPGDRLLVETDTPYLAPVPYRGKPNRPGYVVETAQRVGEERGWSFEQVVARTTENFYRAFPRAAPKPGSARR